MMMSASEWVIARLKKHLGVETDRDLHRTLQLDIFDMRETVVGMVKGGVPVWGTCAGMIVLADRLTDHRPEPLHLMDIEVSRNAFGRQVDSFEADLEIQDIEGLPFRAVFIRAPVVNK
ncbi:MAG: hypothetical protein QF706_04340, partial [Roseibacillus sp.]|nr:hypothetical protein [Roseibacillus sp.]